MSTESTSIAEASPQSTIAAEDAATRSEQMSLADKLLSTEPAAEVDPQAEAQDQSDAGGVPRDEKGRFAAKAGEQPADDAKQKADGETEDDKGSEQQEPPAEVPAHLPPAIKEIWSELPPAARDVVAASLLESRRTMSTLGNDLRNMDRHLAPFRAVAREHGAFLKENDLHPAQAFSNLMQWRAAIDRNPTDAMLRMAQTYKSTIDWPRLAAAFASRDSAQPQLGDGLDLPPDPEVDALRRTVASLESRLEQELSKNSKRVQSVAEKIEARERAEREAATQQYAAQVSSTSDLIAEREKADPDFKRLLDSGRISIEVAALQKADPRADFKDLLEKAFERAGWTDEKVRAKRLASQQSMAQADPAKDDRSASIAARAKAAAQANIRAAGSGQPAAMNLKQEQDEVLRRFNIA